MGEAACDKGEEKGKNEGGMLVGIRVGIEMIEKEMSMEGMVEIVVGFGQER